MKKKECKITLALEERADKIFGKDRRKYRGMSGDLPIVRDDSLSEDELIKQIKDSLNIIIVEKVKKYRSIREYHKQYRERNRECSENYRIKNRDIINQNAREFKKRNKHKCNAYNIKRYASKLNAIPKWMTYEDFKKIEEFYKLARELTEKTNIKHQVDHIIPLKGKTVCGLHCPSNLRVITAKENINKSNKLLDEITYI